MTIPLAFAIFYGEKDLFSFIFSQGIILFFFLIIKPFNSDTDKNLGYKEGLVVVSLGWIIISLFGAIPYILTGSIIQPLNAFFESVSGFTTTGASVIKRTEYLSKSILIWRSLTHWLGGMGIIVMAIAILPELTGSNHLFYSEVTGPLPQNIKPGIRETARTIMYIYICLTILEFFLLISRGMSSFLALVYSFSTISTGGFAANYLSIGGFEDQYIRLIIILFMFLGGMNFALIYKVFQGKILYIFKDEEFRFYCFILFTAIILISLNLKNQLYNDLFPSIKESIFQVISIATTTGFFTSNFDIWPPLSKWILFVLMFVGGCAGSTAGGIKVVRIKALLKICKKVFQKILDPEKINYIRFNNTELNTGIINSILSFFFLYIILFVVSVTIITAQGTDIISSISAVAASLGNVGPALNLAGPLNTYLNFNPISRFVLIICMLLGRLEIYTVLAFIWLDWR